MTSGDRSQLTVLGAGYVGLVTAIGLTEAGHAVELVERTEKRLKVLEQGQSPIFEPGLDEALLAAFGGGRLTVSGSISPSPGVVFVCVGTPIGEDGRSDLSQIRSALDDVSAVAGPDTTLVIRSTLPVGGSIRTADWSTVPTARRFTNPEFLRQGSALHDIREPSRVVIGTYPDADPGALARLHDLVGAPGVETLVVDVTASEMIKNGANAFLALKLSFTNELASLAEAMGTDVGQVLVGIGADPRIGGSYLNPSFGFGGSCLPKELQTFAVVGRSVGLPMHVTTAASTANLASQERFADQIGVLVGGLQGKTIGLLGLAFKAGTDDVRGSPALRLASTMMASGARVRAFDPAAATNARASLKALETVDRAGDTFENADAVVVATEWPEFANLPFASLQDQMRVPLIIDGRRLLDAAALEALGYRVATVGAPSLAPT